MANLVYEASVYTQIIAYKNFKGEEKETTLYFALDPLQLLQALSGYQPKKIKSGNPALNGKDADMTDEEQIRMIRNLAVIAAGTPSEDGESWAPFEDFDNSIVGKAFLTKLATTDAVRRMFSEKVILDPVRAFVGYAVEDPTNSPKELQEMKDMLHKMELLFKIPDPTNESADDRRMRLQMELASLETKPDASE